MTMYDYAYDDYLLEEAFESNEEAGFDDTFIFGRKPGAERHEARRQGKEKRRSRVYG